MYEYYNIIEEKEDNMSYIIEIFLKNVIVIYNEEDNRVYDVIFIYKNMVYIGKIIKIDKNEIFVEGGNIPKVSIKRIVVGNRKILNGKNWLNIVQSRG